MTPAHYLDFVLLKYAVPRGQLSPAERFGNVVARPLQTRARSQFEMLQYSGSYAIQTGVYGESDLDVFISFKSNMRQTPKELYDGLVDLAQDRGWSRRRQNVPVGVVVDGTRVDLMPGKLQPSYQNHHSLLVRKRDPWTQMNVALHVDTERCSGRLQEIRALKIWRLLQRRKFAPMYLELFAIDALAGRARSSLAANVLYVSHRIGSSFPSTHIVDPASASNILLDDLTLAVSQTIALQARRSASASTWERIIC